MAFQTSSSLHQLAIVFFLKTEEHELTESLGKLNSSCRIELLKYSSNLSRAQTIHSSNDRGLSVTKNVEIESRISFCDPPDLKIESIKFGVLKYMLTFSAGRLKKPSNKSRAHYYCFFFECWLNVSMSVMKGRT